MYSKVNQIAALFWFGSALMLQIGRTSAVLKSNIPEIGRMNFLQHCEELHLQCEQHDVVTDDGYILAIFRIVGDTNRPVLMWHGLLDSADSSILRGVNSTGFALAEAGYDVWVGNSRGNRYSRRHKTLNPDEDKQFWDFSFHESGFYDLPATIDMVLEKTGQEKLFAMGHSQGTAIFYVLASSKPEYNEKVKLFISLAPIAYLTNLKSVLRDLFQLWPAVNTILKLSGAEELFQDQSSVNKIIQLLCTQGKIGPLICMDIILMTFVGSDSDEIELEFSNVIFGRIPAGTSRKSVQHFVQIYFRKRFANFDYGAVKNIEKYGTTNPTVYDLGKVSAPVALLCGANDRVSTLEDVELLRKELPNVVFYKVMDRKEFNHFDFIWGRNMNVYLNPLLKDLLDEFS